LQHFWFFGQHCNGILGYGLLGLYGPKCYDLALEPFCSKIVR